MNQGLIYLFFAYTVIWVVVFFYLLNISRKIRDLRKEINSLKK